MDALTGRLVKWEQSGYTITSIAYDQPLPDRLFTWKPPAGIQVTEIGDWWGERLGRTLATAQSRSWDLTIHAVDVAANGDIWLTASWQFQDPQLNTWGTTPLPGELTDDRGRVYTAFMGIGGGAPTRMVNGYTPREPRRAGDPFPTRMTLTPPSGSRLDLLAPPPATWTRPPIDPLAVAHPERWTGFDDRTREEARRRERGRAEGAGGPH